MRDMMDIALSNHTTPLIQGGDFVIGECTGEHQYQLLLNNKGDFKENPTIGVGVDSYEDDDNGGVDVKQEITKQFQQDGMEVETLTPNPDSLTDDTARIFMDAYYI